MTYHYDGRDGTPYSSDTVPNDAGNYTVIATFAAIVNYQAVRAKAEFIIAKKSIAVTWSGLNQVYGRSESVTVSLLDVVDGDNVDINITGVKEAVGRHPLTATLIGAYIANYTLKNSAAMLTIQPKQVIFTVTGNAVQATITADDAAFSDYTVSYWRTAKRCPRRKMLEPRDLGGNHPSQRSPLQRQ